ncbi:hypothetical protein K432DRAFT_330997 [Lepidopterella palustris CBS 459.81]|uniref:Protein kinase domain-containing protein n=1 Tax=Lepidopterella palustris CBS 459.81 TaxID=1314670 RepID=A0A8E2E852_9PEZI|nr:hypothetical protein K432DRAFT_330997 [Lepidopterella palustris CBS 459.81]
MTGVELGLAIVATVDICLKHGRTLVHMCAAFKNAETAIAHRILRVKQSWTRASYHLDFLRRVAHILPPEYQQLQNQTLEVLLEKLKITITMLESMVKGESSTPMHDQTQQTFRVRRGKYARSEERLNKAIDDLETWQGIFDPSWYLIIKAAIPQVDEELARYAGGPAQKAISTTHSLKHALSSGSQNPTPIWLPEDGLVDTTLIDIPFSPARVAQRPNSSRELILESISVPRNVNIAVLTKDIREFARKLSHADPVTFGLLNCKGVTKHFEQPAQHPSAFTFVFRMPDGYSKPTSLRKLLIERNSDHSLSDRFTIACQLAKSVGYIHTFGFVHKNVRPDNILMLKPREGSMEHAYLVGFEQVRTAEGTTSRIGDTAWERNLYRHPRRQGGTPEEDYVMQHDIYSLGVCLLELGIWRSFVDYEPGELGPQTPRPSLALELSSESVGFDKSFLVKDHLQSLARRALPRCMGTKYANIVETCLTCLDPDNTDFGDEREFQDSDGILVGVRYIEKILMQLNTISV